MISKSIGRVKVVYRAMETENNDATIYSDLSFTRQDRFALRVVPANDPLLSFSYNELVCIDLLLLNISAKTQSVALERVSKDSNPLSVHKILIDNQSDNVEFEILEGRSLCLKILFFTKQTGVFPLKLFRVMNTVGGKRVEVEYECPDIIIKNIDP